MFSINDILTATRGKLLQGKKNQTIQNISTDSRTIKPGDLFIAIKGDSFDGHKFLSQVVKKKAGAVIVEKRFFFASPKIPVVLVENSIQALGRIAHYHRRRFKIPVIAVTGSAGKTTTKDMIVEVLKSRRRVLFNEGTQNNHIGVPMTILKLKKTHQVAVIECGTNQPGDISWLAEVLRPTAVVFTNIGESHLERLRNLKGVFEEKRLLVKYLDDRGVIIFNQDDPWLNKLSRYKKGPRKISFSIMQNCDYQARNIQRGKNFAFNFVVNGQNFRLKALGLENVSNALAAIACGRLLKISYNDIARALKNFQCPDGRQQCSRVKEVFIVHDAYNANPVSVRSAVNALNGFTNIGKRIFICADMLELGAKARMFHDQVGQLIAQSQIEVLFTFGDLSRRISIEAQKKRRDIIAEHFESLEKLNASVREIVEPRDIVWVKGSRRMKMGLVVEFLKKSL